MRKSTLILLMILFQLKANSQEIDSLNVYSNALKIHISHKIEFYKNNPKLKFSDELYLEENEFTTNKIPKVILGKKITIVNKEDIYNLTK